MMYDLNTFLPPDSGWDLEGADGINNLGQITGWGVYNGQTAAFLLTPNMPAVVPEPTSWLLLATCAATLGAQRFLRKA